jgi:DNA-binding transcriptional LysR family regulator
VSLREGFTPELLKLLGAGDADVAVVSFPGTHHLDGFELRKICDDFMYVAVAGGHRLAGQRQVRLADLRDEEWIAGSSEPADTLISACLRTGFQPRIGFVARDWMAKQGFVAAGIGITMVPSLAADAVRRDVKLVLLHPDDVPPRQVYSAITSGFTPSPATRAFLDVLHRKEDA